MEKTFYSQTRTVRTFLTPETIRDARIFASVEGRVFIEHPTDSEGTLVEIDEEEAVQEPAVARARKWVAERESPMEARRVTRDRGKVYIERIYSGRLTTPGTAIAQRLWVFEDQWAAAGESVEALIASGVRSWEEGTWTL